MTFKINLLAIMAAAKLELEIFEENLGRFYKRIIVKKGGEILHAVTYNKRDYETNFESIYIDAVNAAKLELTKE